jgi:hypothetical protein
MGHVGQGSQRHDNRQESQKNNCQADHDIDVDVGQIAVAAERASLPGSIRPAAISRQSRAAFSRSNRTASVPNIRNRRVI